MCSLPLLAGSGHVPFVVVCWNTVVCSHRSHLGTQLAVPADFLGGTLLVDPLECEAEQCVRSGSWRPYNRNHVGIVVGIIGSSRALSSSFLLDICALAKRGFA